MKKILIAAFLVLIMLLQAENKITEKDNGILVKTETLNFVSLNGKTVFKEDGYIVDDEMYKGIPLYKIELENGIEDIRVKDLKKKKIILSETQGLKLPDRSYTAEYLNGKKYLYVFPIIEEENEIYQIESVLLELVADNRDENDLADDFGYIAEISDFTAEEWIDISDTEPLTLSDGGFSEPLELPFDFPFYSGNYSEIYVGADGLLSFSPTDVPTHMNQRIPYLGAPDNFIAPFWDDLKPTGGTWGEVYAGSAVYGGENVWVVMYDHVKHPYSFLPEHTETFEAVLHPSGQIDFLYLDLFNPNSVTAGIENADGTDGIEVVFNAPLLNDMKKITFVLQDDTVPPMIMHSAVEGGVDGVNPVLFAEVSDNQEVASVKLSYSLNGEDIVEDDFMTADNGSYEYNFTNINFGDSVAYYITATDIAGNLSRLPENENSFFSFFINLQTPGNLTFNIEDEVSYVSWHAVEGADKYEIYYRLDRGDEWTLLNDDLEETEYSHELSNIAWKTDRRVNVLFYRIIAKSIH
ncbi:MAG: hypothetical protein CSB55_00930 [Candidatus Cloacimonadota bacterium]|nr:MAG: hypothetical protein CSB55_00930 [Candidatus Cloacimonadota bacterium]